MNWHQIVARSARKTLIRIPKADSARLERALNQLTRDPRNAHVKQLKPGSTEYSMRVGSYRILFDRVDKYHLLIIQNIDRRSDTTYR